MLQLSLGKSLIRGVRRFHALIFTQMIQMKLRQSIQDIICQFNYELSGMGLHNEIY